MRRIASFAKWLFYSVIGYSLSLVVGGALGLYVAVRILLNPKDRFWRHQTNAAPPACLTDPALGTHGYIQTKSVRLHYVGKGDRTKPLMLCLHGLPEFWFSWRHILKEFSSHYWVVALDMKGAGDSDRPEGRKHYTLAKALEEVKDCIKGLGKDKCILVANDFGGLVAFCLVSLEPQFVESYVILNSVHPTAFRRLFYRFTMGQVLKSWYIFAVQLPYCVELYLQLDNFLLLEKLFKGVSFFSNIKKAKSILSQEELEAYKYMLKRPGAITSALNCYRANFMDEDPVEKAGEITKVFPPGLILYGEKDAFFIKKTQKETMKLISNATLVYLKEGNHFPHQNSPKDVIEEMKMFLNTP